MKNIEELSLSGSSVNSEIKAISAHDPTELDSIIVYSQTPTNFYETMDIFSQPIHTSMI